MLGKIKVRRKRQFAEQRELGRSIAVSITNLNVERGQGEGDGWPEVVETLTSGRAGPVKQAQMYVELEKYAEGRKIRTRFCRRISFSLRHSLPFPSPPSIVVVVVS